MATSGYRSKLSFVELAAAGSVVVRTSPSLVAGALTETGNPFDLAIDGPGFFELRGADGPVYTRDGHFKRADDGRLLGAGGLPLQAIGGDLVAPAADATVSRDGVLLVDGEAAARLRVVHLEAADLVEAGDGLFRSVGRSEDVAAPVVRQGFLEGANVALGQEMIVLMESVRRAEAGQRLMNVYDDLLGRAVTAFGAGGA
ncbi:flagellar basal body rod C-terminal domain-containing protein [Brevundimonas intermedia]